MQRDALFASGRVAFREYVTDEDADVAISVMLHSFISAQKAQLQKYFRLTPLICTMNDTTVDGLIDSIRFR